MFKIWLLLDLSNKMAGNGRACCCAGILFRSARNVSPIEKLLMKITTKDEQ